MEALSDAVVYKRNEAGGDDHTVVEIISLDLYSLIVMETYSATSF